jgi:hypothetical protein
VISNACKCSGILGKDGRSLLGETIVHAPIAQAIAVINAPAPAPNLTPLCGVLQCGCERRQYALVPGTPRPASHHAVLGDQLLDRRSAHLVGDRTDDMASLASRSASACAINCARPKVSPQAPWRDQHPPPGGAVGRGGRFRSCAGHDHGEPPDSVAELPVVDRDGLPGAGSDAVDLAAVTSATNKNPTSTTCAQKHPARRVLHTFRDRWFDG